MSVKDVFIAYVAPAIGNVLAAILMLSPLPAVLRAKKIQHLEYLNPLPFPGTLAVGTAFLGYALVLGDPWLTPGSLLGACAGLWFSLSVIPFMTRKSQEYMMAFLLGALLFYAGIAILGVFAVSPATELQIWGITGVITLFIFYALPLSTIGTVIKTRNSASIYMPLAICTVLNSGLWSVYGFFALKSIYVWLPQTVGAILGTVQIILRCVIPVKAYEHALATPTESTSVESLGMPEDKPPIKLDSVDSRTALRVVVHPE